jgi:two-component system chemotaxis response regulator CheB
MTSRTDRKDIVVMGASAGGMDALQKVAAELPADLPAAIFVVWHLSPGLRSLLPQVLTRAGPLPAAHPEDGDPILPGRIYIAPPDHHMLLERDYIRVAKGPKENRFRPAVDPLFRSAAYAFGPRAVGIVLSGALDDGTSGLWTIKLRGGTAIVQDPADALHRPMPLNAMESVEVDYKLAARDIGRLLPRLVREPAGAAPAMPEAAQRLLEHEVRVAEEAEALDQHIMQHGTLSPFTCPECHGVLTQLRDGRIVRFRCHTGHAFSAASLLAETTEQVETRLWDGVRAFDEVILLLNRMGEEHAKAGNLRAAEECFDGAREAHERSRPVREAAMHTEKPAEEKTLREVAETPRP